VLIAIVSYYILLILSISLPHPFISIILLSSISDYLISIMIHFYYYYFVHNYYLVVVYENFVYNLILLVLHHFVLIIYLNLII